MYVICYKNSKAIKLRRNANLSLLALLNWHNMCMNLHNKMLQQLRLFISVKIEHALWCHLLDILL